MRMMSPKGVFPPAGPRWQGEVDERTDECPARKPKYIPQVHAEQRVVLQRGHLGREVRRPYPRGCLQRPCPLRQSGF
jgi:hypothetical protein